MLLLKKGSASEAEVATYYPTVAHARSHLDFLVDAGVLLKEGRFKTRYRTCDALTAEYAAVRERETALSREIEALAAMETRLGSLKRRVYAGEQSALGEALRMALDALQAAGAIGREDQQRLSAEIGAMFFLRERAGPERHGAAGADGAGGD